MVNRPHLFFKAPERSYFSIIKKDVHHAVVDAMFGPQKVAEIDIVVSELLSNLAKHGRDGYLLVKVDKQYIEILAIDEGAGMTDVSRMVQDGVSTKNTLGNGLGAIKRLSDVFQVYSLKDWGTVVLSRIFNADAGAERDPKFDVKGLLVAKPGETYCGDGWHVRISPDKLKIFMGDGLGHGLEAEKAVNEAITCFNSAFDTTAFELLRTLHKGVKKTRGLVGAAAFLDFKEKQWSICGIGNIHTRIASPADVKTYMSYNGVLGLNIPNTMKDLVTPAERGQVLIMCSDGIKTKWDTAKYPNIFKYDLSIILAVIFKDHARRTDDMGLLAVKCNY